MALISATAFCPISLWHNVQIGSMATQPTLKDYIGISTTSGLELAELVE